MKSLRLDFGITRKRQQNFAKGLDLDDDTYDSNRSAEINK